MGTRSGMACAEDRGVQRVGSGIGLDIGQVTELRLANERSAPSEIVKIAHNTKPCRLKHFRVFGGELEA